MRLAAAMCLTTFRASAPGYVLVQTVELSWERFITLTLLPTGL